MERSTLVPTICPYCGVGCGFNIIVQNGTAVGLEYMKDHPTSEGALCPKGNAALDAIYNRERLLYPQKRVKGRLERISWDEALGLIADKFSAIRREQGADALGFLSSAKCSNEENYLFQKLARMLGTNNVDHCARL
jgi:formate dehydrogenase major subunit